MNDDEKLAQVQQIMSAFGGMTALASADLPARIAKTWAETATLLMKLIEPRVLGQNAEGKPQVQMLLDEDDEAVVYDLIRFCLSRIALVAASQPKGDEQ